MQNNAIIECIKLFMIVTETDSSMVFTVFDCHLSECGVIGIRIMRLRIAQEINVCIL